MIIPSTRLFTAGEVETGAYLNSAVTNLGNFMLGKPIFQAYQSTVQSIANGTFTPITFTSETIDRDNGHSTVTNTSRFTAQTAGWYFISGKVAYAANVSGQRLANWNVNGAQVSMTRYAPITIASIPSFALADNRLVYLNVNDYLELIGYQDSGVALNTFISGSIENCYMTAIWVSS
jgi:hypothetical protein